MLETDLTGITASGCNNFVKVQQNNRVKFTDGRFSNFNKNNCNLWKTTRTLPVTLWTNCKHLNNTHKNIQNYKTYTTYFLGMYNFTNYKTCTFLKSLSLWVRFFWPFLSRASWILAYENMLRWLGLRIKGVFFLKKYC